VDFDEGGLGTPAPGTFFDTTTPPASHGALARWARALLRARDRSPKGSHPILPVEIRGHGKDTMVRRLSTSLPAGVEVYVKGGRQVFPINNPEGVPTTRAVFYLVAR